VSAALHPAAPHSLPSFITAPGETDVFFVVSTTLVVLIILLVGVMFFWMHSLPERVAHKSKKLQFEIVAILGLLSLFTHQHIFWVIALILAFIEIPNFSHPLRSMAHSLERLAGRGNQSVQAPASLAEGLPATTPDVSSQPEPPAAAAPAAVAVKQEGSHA
jgi:hypothetical protein